MHLYRRNEIALALFITNKRNILFKQLKNNKRKSTRFSCGFLYFGFYFAKSGGLSLVSVENGKVLLVGFVEGFEHFVLLVVHLGFEF